MNTLTATEIAVPSHSGLPLEPERRFLSPPAELGDLISAFSRPRSGRFDPKGQRIALLWGGVVSLFFFGLLSLVGLAPIERLVLALPAGLLLYVPLLISSMRREITYVGTKGLYRWRAFLGKPTEEFFRFDGTSTVHFHASKEFHNGVYTHTSYTFCFRNKSKEFQMHGAYHSLTDNVPPEDDYHFGRSGEKALALFQLPFVQARLELGKAEKFALSGGRVLLLTRSTLTLEHGGKSETISLDELERVEVKAGQITLARKGGKAGFLGLGRDGIFTVEYGDLPNALLFLAALKQTQTTALLARAA